VAAYLGDRVETIVKTYILKTGEGPSRALGVLFGVPKVGASGAGKPKALQ
jgi:hypothetical protein